MNFWLILVMISTSPINGINFGIGSNGEACLGYRKGPALPFLSLSFMVINAEYTYFFQSHNDLLPDPYQERIDGDTLNGKIGLLTPRLGTRIIFTSNPIKPYINLAASAPLPLFITLQADDSTEQAEFDSLKARLYDEPEPTITVSAGIGFEKFISERLSIAGELNYNYQFGGIWLQDRYQENTNQTYWEKEKSHLKYQIGRTSTALWLTYYF